MNWSAAVHRIAVADPLGGPEVAVLLVLPTEAPEAPVRLGGWPAHVAVEAPPAPLPAASTPLVLVSHGTGSTPLLHRALAADLARHGFVVAAVEHPGNCRGDDALAGTARILADRPRHLRLVADHLLGGREDRPGIESLVAALRPALLPGRYAVVGHSLGGYTALALAGGHPGASARETPDGVPAAVPVDPDPRVAALVLLSPATPWFLADGSLRDVDVPILVHTGAQNLHTPPWHARLVADGVADPAAVELHLHPDAGHFSFTSPVPAEMVDPARPPTVDPPGFDRAAVAPMLWSSVREFLGRTLTR